MNLRHQNSVPIVITHAIKFGDIEWRRACALVCKHWRCVIVRCGFLLVERRHLDPDEVRVITDRIMSAVYTKGDPPNIRNLTAKALQQCMVPVSRDTGCFIECLIQRTANKINTGLLSTKTNVGALDTMCTMEKMTQRKLSKFHHTGTHSETDQSSLGMLITSQSSVPVYGGNMCIYLKKGWFASSTDILRKLSGKVIETKVGDFFNCMKHPTFLFGYNHRVVPAIARAALWHYQDMHPMFTPCVDVATAIVYINGDNMFHNRFTACNLAAAIDNNTKNCTYTVPVYDDSVGFILVVTWQKPLLCTYRTTGVCKGSHLNLGTESIPAAYKTWGKCDLDISDVTDMQMDILYRVTVHKCSQIVAYHSILGTECKEYTDMQQWINWSRETLQTELRGIIGQLESETGSGKLPQGCTESPCTLADVVLHHTFPYISLPFYIATVLYPPTRKYHATGIRGITRASVYWNASAQEYVIQTTGSNMHSIIEKALLTKELECVDINRCSTNNLSDITQTLGIEALYRIYSNSRVGGVNQSCIKSIVDHILRDGVVNTHRHNPVLNEIAVENPQKHMSDASVHGNTDHMTGVSARVLCGKTIESGTLGHSIIFDVNALICDQNVSQ